MTEEEYIAIQNLVHMRSALDSLSKIMPCKIDTIKITEEGLKGMRISISKIIEALQAYEFISEEEGS